MQAIADHVFIEDQFAGVTLGAIALPHGLIQIDAPPLPEDVRAWRASLMNTNSGPDRILVNLDAHPDRTLGARAMECTLITHEKTASVFRSRPMNFKGQGEDTGADWESVVGLGSVRWSPPEISFTHNMELHWGDTTVLLEHHPGPAAGALWAILPSEKIVFVGDAVLKNQPPFLDNAHIPTWLEALNLLAKDYRDYIIVSGRGGVVTQAVVANQIEYLEKIQSELDALARMHVTSDAIEALVRSLLAASKAPTLKHKQYAQRLRYGLSRYYARHYGSNTVSADE